MAKKVSDPYVEPIKKPTVHKCNNYMFVTHEVDWEIKTLAISFSKERYSECEYKVPSDTKYVDYKHCPYCGHKFEVEIEEVLTTQ